MSNSLTTQANAGYRSLPLYSGPEVTFRIASTNSEYKLFKALVCQHTLVFKAKFEGSFLEGQEQETTLVEEDGIVSIRSFQLLVQWMYLGQVFFGDLSPAESITAAIEFTRFAEMYGVIGMEGQMAEHIRALVNDSSPPYRYEFDSNTYLIDSKHIASAVQLPQGHRVREVLAAASVRGYFKDDDINSRWRLKKSQAFHPTCWKR